MSENLVSLQLFDGIVTMHVHVYACAWINMSSRLLFTVSEVHILFMTY